jgi:hypothetical protein
MNDSKDPPDAERARKENDEARRRLREKVFGDVLPDTTADERDGGTDRDGSGSDEWLRRNVPPHHG